MALLISPETILKLEKLESYAVLNPFTLSKIKDIMSGKISPAGDIPEYSIIVPVGYKIVYSIEEHPVGFARHLSVSSPSKGMVPGEYILNLIMKHLKFDGRVDTLGTYVYTEDVTEDIKAINVVEVINDIKSFSQYVKDISDRTKQGTSGLQNN